MSSVSGLEGIYINTIDNLPYENDFNNSNFLKINGTNAMDARLDMNSNRIINVDDPISIQDAATKKYVDDSLITDYVTLTTNQTITGEKTFTTQLETDFKLICVNNINGINTGWGIGASSQNGTCTILGTTTKTGILTIKGTLDNSLIQQTTYNLHLDNIYNIVNDGGIFLNFYSENRNTYINPNFGLGQCLIGTLTADNAYKCSIDRGDRTNALKVTGPTLLNGTLSMNSNFITNVLDPINDQDAATKKYVTDHTSGAYVTIGTTQTITGIKDFSNGVGSAYILTCRNDLLGINTGWGIGTGFGSSQAGICAQFGNSTDTGIIMFKGTINNSLIQQTTHNLHFDTIKNDTNDGGLYLNLYAFNRNTVINPQNGLGQCLIGTITVDNNYKCTINKGDRTNAIKVLGTTLINSNTNALILDSSDANGTNLRFNVGGVDKFTLKAGTDNTFALKTPTESIIKYDDTTKQINLEKRINLPPFTTSERNALTPSARDVLYNSTTNSINYYNASIWQPIAENSTITSFWNGPITPPVAATINISQTGKIVHISILQSVYASSSSSDIFTFNTTLPVGQRPPATVSTPLLVWNSPPKRMGYVTVDTSGIIGIYADVVGNNFGSGISVGFEPITFSFCII